MTETPLVLPLDGANQALVDNVHPSGWENPSPAAVYHWLVVGGGTAGLTGAIVAAELGARVAVIEKHLLGGERLLSGSVPSQTLLRAARAWREARRAGEYGVRAIPTAGDFAAAMERMRRLRADLSSGDSAWRLRELGIDLFIGTARFTAIDALEVDGRTLRFRRALLATGARPRLPEVPGLAEIGCLTTDALFTLTELPRRLAVVGDGARACELAQAFARFGSQVTLLYSGPELLPEEDAECAAIVRKALEADGVRCVGEARLLALDKPARSKVLHFEVGDNRHQLPVDELLVAWGRQANVEGLGLDAAGIACGSAGLTVDARLRTSNPRVFACGEVVSGSSSSHAVAAQARLATRNALLDRKEEFRADSVPACVYTQPELARVGPTAAELERRGVRFRTVDVPMASVDRARLEGAPEGLLRLQVRQRSGLLIGASLVGDLASETIAALALARERGIGLERLADAVLPYPSYAEMLRQAGSAWRGARVGKWKKRLLALRFRRQEKSALRDIAKRAPAALAAPPNAEPSA